MKNNRCDYFGKRAGDVTWLRLLETQRWPGSPKRGWAWTPTCAVRRRRTCVGHETKTDALVAWQKWTWKCVSRNNCPIRPQISLRRRAQMCCLNSPFLEAFFWCTTCTQVCCLAITSRTVFVVFFPTNSPERYFWTKSKVRRFSSMVILLDHTWILWANNHRCQIELDKITRL